MVKKVKQAKKVISIIMALVIAISAVIPMGIQPTSFAKSSNEVKQIEVGKTTVLNVTGKQNEILWESSDESIATVTSKGKVTGIAPGTATITAKGYDSQDESKGKNAVTTKFTINVIMKASKPNNDGAHHVKEDEMIRLQVNGNHQILSWESSDIAIATVDKNGIVTGVSEGSAVIKVTLIKGNGNNKKESEIEFKVTVDSVNEKYTVTFNTNGGSEVASQIVEKGQQVTKPEAPTKDGYIFVGWYKDKEYTDYYEFSKEVVMSDFTLYAAWLDIENPTDTDNDDISDSLEDLLGLDKTKEDTDGDGLSDYIEINDLGLDPLKKDSDDNGILDDDEDNDSDGLSNSEEIKHGTNPIMSDTDMDKLTDFEEVNQYKTNPLKIDTDNDGASDGIEVELGTDPLVAQELFNMNVFSAEKDNVKASVEMTLSGEQVQSLKVEKMINETFFTEQMPGYIGSAYNFSVDGSFDSATIKFEFDSSLLNEENFDPVIYYYNEDEQVLEELPTTVTNNVATAVTNHFSTYILINRKVYQEAFIWEDVWDSNNYTSTEVIFVIDDSGSMTSNDSTNNRLTVAQSLIDNLPNNSKIGVVKFANSTPEILTKTLTSDKDAAKSYLTTNYFKSNGGTYMYNAINGAFPLFESDDELTLRAIIVLSDGATSDTSKHSSVITTANDKSVKIYTVGLGSSTSYFNNYLKPLANNTGGKFYLASNADELSEIYGDIGNKIDIQTDSDGDGIPDYYEDNMILFDGSKITLDKNKADTDGDGISDGEELELKYEYNVDKTQVIVTGKLNANPVKIDSDGDGLYDNQAIEAYGNIIAPIDPQPLFYDGPTDAWKNHIGQQQSEKAPYAEDPDDNNGLGVIVNEQLADFIVRGLSFIRTLSTGLEEIYDMLEGTIVETMYKEACIQAEGTIDDILTYTKKKLKDANIDTETIGYIAAEVGAYLLNFVPDNHTVANNKAYHSQFDTWQKNFGYNKIYDEVFDCATKMDMERVLFDAAGDKYALWMWKGDYLNLEAGAEVGLYKYKNTYGSVEHYDAIDIGLPMTLSLYSHKIQGYSPDLDKLVIDSDHLFSWYPEEKQWWITGFTGYKNEYKDTKYSHMLTISSIDFSNGDVARAMFNGLKGSNEYFLKLNSANNGSYLAIKYGKGKKYRDINFIFDTVNYKVWILWEPGDNLENKVNYINELHS